MLGLSCSVFSSSTARLRARSSRRQPLDVELDNFLLGKLFSASRSARRLARHGQLCNSLFSKLFSASRSARHRARLKPLSNFMHIKVYFTTLFSARLLGR